MDNICRDCKYWGYNNRKPMNDVGESRCLRLKRKTHACQYCRDFSAKESRKRTKSMKIISVDELNSLIDAKLYLFKKEIVDFIDAQLTVSDINASMERLSYELEKAIEHKNDLTTNSVLYHINQWYISVITEAIQIIKEGTECSK